MDPTSSQGPVPPPIPPSAAPAGPATLNPKQIEDGKLLGAACYLPIPLIGLVVSIVVLVMRSNAFALYHAKQALTLYLTMFAAGILMVPVMLIPVINCAGFFLWIALVIFALVMLILGIVNSLSGKLKPLPLIGAWADKLFGGIKVQEPGQNPYGPAGV